MDPELFLKLAVTLKCTPGNRPEFYRTAISRAYYAAFNLGVEVLKSVGIRPTQGPGGHGELRNCLNACGDPICGKISSRLGTLHTRRIAADYAMTSPSAETQSEAELACQEATAIVGDLKSLRDDAGRSQARSELKRVARETFKLAVS